MAGRYGHRRVDHSSPLADLDDVFADDALIDAIAAGPWGAAQDANRVLPASGRHGTPEAITELLDNWRRELAHIPIPDLPPIPQAFGVAERPRPKRSYRPALAVAAAIAALLVGSTFAGSRQATEGSALWGVTSVLWPDRVESVASRDKVRTAIGVAQVALREGRQDDAQAALIGASFEIGKVDETDGRQDLQSSLEGLWKQAAPAGSTLPPSERNQLAASSAPTSTRSTTTAFPPSGAVELAIPLPSTGVQVPLQEAPAGPVLAALGIASSSVTPAAGVIGDSAAAAVAVPGNSAEEVPVSASDNPAASTELTATPVSPTTETTGAPPTSSTEPAPAPTPSVPTSTVNSPGAATEQSAGAASAAQSTAESSTSTADSTAVLPTP